MYTEDGYYGGGIPLRYDQTYYYVKASGNDGNPGTRDLPFKTLAKAVQTARYKTSTTAPWIKTIVVLGDLNWDSEKTQSDSDYKEINSVFVIPNAPSGVQEPDLIRITGDDPATPAIESAQLAGESGKRVLFIDGNKSKVQLAHIELYGGNADWGAGIRLENGARLTITEGTVIRDNTNTQSGGGVWIEDAVLQMTGGEIRNNYCIHDGNNGTGGGVYLSGTGQSVFQMFGGTIRDNRAKRSAGVVVNSGTFRMFNGSIRDNIIFAGNTGWAGGVGVSEGATFIMSGGAITGNVYNAGNNSGRGGGVRVRGEFWMTGPAQISGNFSKNYGGGVFVDGGGAFYLDTSEGASITGNTANGSGSQVYNNGEFKLNGAPKPIGPFESIP
jgi:hypothetical protein